MKEGKVEFRELQRPPSLSMVKLLRFHEVEEVFVVRVNFERRG